MTDDFAWTPDINHLTAEAMSWNFQKINQVSETLQNCESSSTTVEDSDSGLQKLECDNKRLLECQIESL